MNAVYITSIGKFLPGAPIGNDAIEAYLGQIGGKSSKAMRRVLDQNKIRTRYYAIDTDQKSLYSNAEMAAHAIRDSLERNHDDLADRIDFLAVGTTQGDLLVPGFASMVHAETRLPAMEIATHHGVCGSGMQAIKNAFLQVQSGEKKAAVSCASEFSSRVFKHTRFEAQAKFMDHAIPFDTDFLRFMLSDGAGAAVLQHKPSDQGLSLRIEWIDNKSYANLYDTCMYAGMNKDAGAESQPGWLDYASIHEAANDGAINLKQDIRLVNEMPKVGVNRFFELVDEGKVNPSDIDWMVCHYSSHYFREEIFRLMQLGGMTIPEDRWFTNLYTKGNTGAASIYIMLEELFNEGHLKPGEKVLCMVPESGRFQTSYMLLTVVGTESRIVADAMERQPEAPHLDYDASNSVQSHLVRKLVNVWIDFEQKLARVPIIHKLYRGKFTLDDYKLLMENIRQQVIDGSQWIARAASYIAIEHIELRSMFIAHARDEHRDFQMLERNYAAVGGDLAVIQSGEKNIGSEALSAYLFQRASRENPVDLMGAMWIIEGLGCRMARHWGEAIRDQLRLNDDQVSFLLYHSDSDEKHFERLEAGIQHPMLTMALAERIVKTAKTTARLYLLQLEELGNV
ncbi:3-oxoacyl-[acyl-carrier-protein] synthase III C-terminal domain-containing protein [Paenibacillus sacheonensis]|uniref:3-oxoacyl-ACP synthase n=1 Tax=Paenibacillus sacheonensis TaxID=742054 RepID=A0A7X4YPA1_9BACL|nr:3-oxoacyl-[acyl-carrier-protein] synthase III C-terminal domain-containing protein [Paenibacillus sacheonensis]MBM7565195.1 3-oxoacyl-[acyl-carrier-protein] synthase-3 [Paenibacillus sacheonensis]NBC70027.1 3-oxoacyl-ACP synthase [Paenibacillus sacheonensis]